MSKIMQVGIQQTDKFRMLRKKTLSHTVFYPAKILSKTKASQFTIPELCKTVKGMKSELTNWERISGNQLCSKGLPSRIYGCQSLPFIDNIVSQHH